MLRAIRWSSRVYRALVRVYPKRFLSDYADEMVWCFEDMCLTALQKRGTVGLALLWLRILPDWCITVTKEHLQTFGYQGAKDMDYITFNTQLTSTLALLTRALRSGYNIKQSCEIVIDHAPEPTKEVFQRLLAKIEGGVSWLEAFDEISGEMKSNTFDKAMMAMRTQMAEGGNLANRLDEVNREIYAEIGDTGWAKLVDLDDGYSIAEHYPLN